MHCRIKGINLSPCLLVSLFLIDLIAFYDSHERCLDANINYHIDGLHLFFTPSVYEWELFFFARVYIYIYILFHASTYIYVQLINQHLYFSCKTCKYSKRTIIFQQFIDSIVGIYTNFLSFFSSSGITFCLGWVLSALWFCWIFHCPMERIWSQVEIENIPLTLKMDFSNFLVDSLFVTKSNFPSTSIKSIEY